MSNDAWLIFTGLTIQTVTSVWCLLIANKKSLMEHTQLNRDAADLAKREAAVLEIHEYLKNKHQEACKV